MTTGSLEMMRGNMLAWFGATYGMSVENQLFTRNERLEHYRFNLAKELLVETNKSVMDIMRAIGYITAVPSSSNL